MKRQRGFTLVEVMVALLVFTLGLLGVAAMLGVTVKNHQNTHQRAHASRIAGAISERLRANPAGVASGAYNGLLQAGQPALPACPCDATATAQRDLRQLGDLAAQWLPDLVTSIECDADATPVLPGAGAPPYTGRCEVRMQWVEQRDIDAVASAPKQSFSWVLQP